MHEQLRMTPKEFTRYKYHEIDWASRLVGIVGPRGVGKSTMVLQWIINHPESHSLYVSADNLYFSSHTLVDLADDFIKEGGLRLVFFGTFILVFSVHKLVCSILLRQV